MAKNLLTPLGLTGCALLFVSILGLIGFLALDYTTASSAMDSLSADGKAERFTESAFTLARWLGLVLFSAAFCAALVLLFFIDMVRRGGDMFALSWHRLRRDCRAFLVHWWNAVPGTHLAVIVLLILAGIALRMWHMELPIRHDESWTYLYFTWKPYFVILTDYSSNNNHVFHTLLTKLSIDLFGDSSWSLRLPAFVAGCILLPLSYFVTLRFFGQAVALVSLACVTCWPMLIDYSGNARGYTLMVMFTLLLLLVAERFRSHQDASSVLLFVIVAPLGFWTHPTFLLPTGAIGFWLLACVLIQYPMHQWRRVLWPIFIAGFLAAGVTLVLYSPVFLRSGVESVVIHKDAPDLPVLSILEEATNWLRTVWNDLSTGIPAPILYVLIAGLLIGMFRYAKLTAHAVPLWIAWVLWTLVVVRLLGVYPPSRAWIHVIPVLGAISSAGLLVLVPLAFRERFSQMASVLLVACIGLHYVFSPQPALYQGFGTLAEARPLARFLDQEMRPNDLLATNFPANKAIDYYAKKLGRDGLIPKARVRFNEAVDGELPLQTWVLLPRKDQTVEAVMHKQAQRSQFFTQRRLADEVCPLSIEVIRSEQIGNVRVQKVELRGCTTGA